MSTVTESDLKELKDLIISQNQKLTESITEIKLSISELKGNTNARLLWLFRTANF
jgi:hypothetical protein